MVSIQCGCVCMQCWNNALTTLGLSFLSLTEGFFTHGFKNLVHQDVVQSMIFFFLCISLLYWVFCVFEVSRADEKAQKSSSLLIFNRSDVKHDSCIWVMSFCVIVLIISDAWPTTRIHWLFCNFLTDLILSCCFICNQACGKNQAFCQLLSQTAICVTNVIFYGCSLCYSTITLQAFKWILYVSTMDLVKL